MNSKRVPTVSASGHYAEVRRRGFGAFHHVNGILTASVAGGLVAYVPHSMT